MAGDNRHEMIIIGGGLAGLACGALLARKGHRPLIVEMNPQVGGRALGAEEGGFVYDHFPIGLTPVRGHRLEMLARELGLEADHFRIKAPSRVSQAYRGRSGKWKLTHRVNLLPESAGEAPDPGHLFDLWELDAEERLRATGILADLFLKSPEQIRKLDEEDLTLQGYLDRERDDLPSPVYNFLGFFANMAMVEPIDLVSVAEYVRIVQDAFLRGGGGYPEGSMMRVAGILLDLFTGSGGRILTGTRVERILISGGRVRGVRAVDGRELRAPIVISSAGIHPTILKLAGEEHFEAAYVEGVRNLRPAWGLTSQIYFLREPVLDFDMATAYSDDAWWDLERYRRVLDGHEPDDVVLYAQVTSRYHPGLAPPGKQLLSAGTVCPSDPDSPQVPMLIRKAEEMLFRLWPEIEPAIESRRYAGPAEVSRLTRDRVLPGQGGECMGLGQIAGQCGPRRPSFQTSVRGLYLTGIDAGGGEGMGVHQSVHSALRVARHLGA